ncbi:MAG TPA: hypothetical protein VFU43_28780 [Streptosporangiaceae bacterium]|nr:hypothetical protein [Streptosporangiaceae bacterium]
MYIFAIAVLLGLAVTAVSLLIARFISMATELWALLLIALGVGAAWLADFSMFTGWDIPVRENWIGITMTGLVLAGFAEAWYVVLRLLRGLERKYNDEAAFLEREKGLRRVA